MFFSKHAPPSLKKKCEDLERMLVQHHSICIACSGGTDSTFLALYASHVLKKEVHAFLASSPLLARKELKHALSVSAEIGIVFHVVPLDPLAIPAVRENSRLRCYFCKKEIMGRILKEANGLACSTVADGTNADDVKEYRPGARALAELGIISPLAAAGLSKADIRELSKLAGLSTWDRPSQSCLATRIPYGTPLSESSLRRIEKAEESLWSLGCRQVRVRIYGDLAKIEVDEESFPVICNPSTREVIVRQFRDLELPNICLDLAGYKSGCWD